MPVFFSSIAGFFVSRSLAGKKPGQKGRIRSLRIKVRNHFIHIHHWIYGGAVLAVAPMFFEKHPWPYQSVFIGFLIGIVIQGLTYRDFYKIFYKAVVEYNSSEEE